MPTIANLEVFPLCLGGNVFGWSADEPQSFAVLDAYTAARGNFVDSADVYSAWVPGHSGGESEAILGRWMKARGNRDRMVIATKVGQHPAHQGLGKKTIAAACDASLTRLKSDHIDLYYAHIDDAATPLEETLAAFDGLVRAGKVRQLGASNYTAARFEEALAISKRNGWARYVALQPHYNLMERAGFEGELAAVCARENVACVPYFALAKGFLTGKYRPGKQVQSVRAQSASAYLDARGERVLAALDELSERHATTVAAVALAWLRAQSTVAAPIASARTVEQLRDLLPMATLRLTAEELDRLRRAATVS
jgi:aryl-alcohol dehydrogenase-like predicted oxidoreductase